MTTELDAALESLRAYAARAGIDPGVAMSEAAAAAALTCPEAVWLAVFGTSAGRYSSSRAAGAELTHHATETIRRLMEQGRVHDAQAYALALVDVVTAAAGSGDDLSLERINDAGFLATTQLESTGWRPAGEPTPTVSEPSTTPDDGRGTAGAEATTSREAAPTGSRANVEPGRPLDELLAELDGLIGLASVKQEVHHQAAVLRLQAIRSSRGLKTPDVSRHLVFVGNPGTGKTTVARLVAGIYRAVGLLERGQLVETDRSGLVAGYEGQTAIKVSGVVQSALGGVLFVDEAYALAGDQFGQEAIDILVKALEDHRADLVVIVAGYPDEMRDFLSSNPGLASRFPKIIDFADYTDDELIRIFTRLCASSDFSATPACVANLRRLLAEAVRDKGFGNARMVRNLFETAVTRQAWRLRDVAEPSDDQLRELWDVDIDESRSDAADMETVVSDVKSDRSVSDTPSAGDGPRQR